MKRRLGKTTVNPLDLLLDTTSNVFGSMILIAILIALFAGDYAGQAIPKPWEESGEMVERQIRHAEADAAALAAELAKTASGARSHPGAGLLADLQSDIDSLKRQVEAARRRHEQGIQEAIQDYGEEAAGASGDMAASEAEAARQLNAIASDDQQIARTQDRLRELQARLKKERANKVQRLSLPLEHDTSQRGFWIILINNQVYPGKLIGPSGETSPFPGIEVSEIDNGRSLWKPIKGRGISLADSRGDIVELIRRLPRDHYPTLLVFPDSIPAFRQLEELVHGLGREMGWEACDSEDELVFASKGTTPKPQ